MSVPLFSAYVAGEHLAKYKDMYDHYAHLKGKNHAPEHCIREADNYLKEQKGLRKTESACDVQSVKRSRQTSKSKPSQVEIPDEIPLKKREPEINQSPLPAMECEVLEVDFKKLSRVESQWKGFAEVFLEGNAESKKEAFSSIKTFDFTALNN